MTHPGRAAGGGGSKRNAPAVAFVLKGYPRLSETFIAQEILGLERRGLDIRIVSLRRPTDHTDHPVHREIAAPVLYLPEYLHEAPARVLRAWWRARRMPGYRAARRAWRADFLRDRTRNRVRRFGQALVLVAELPDGIERIHAHFLHTPASVARYASLITGLPWSCSAHAKDVWTTPAWEIAEKLEALDWLVTCTESGRAYLAGLGPRRETVKLVYHGLDLSRFPQPPGRTGTPRRDGADPAAPVVVLSVGRIVPKKGFDVLIEALGRLPETLHWRWVHIGGGPRETLERRASQLGIGDRIAWRGAQAQETVLAAYRAADLFVLPCRIAGDGDRDGLPNVLMEAQSQELACLSSTISGIPELIDPGKTGVLVSPDDAAALAGALEDLIANPDQRRRLGAAALARLRADFGQDAGLATLARLFGLEPPARAAAAGT